MSLIQDFVVQTGSRAYNCHATKMQSLNKAFSKRIVFKCRTYYAIEFLYLHMDIWLIKYAYNVAVLLLFKCGGAFT